MKSHQILRLRPSDYRVVTEYQRIINQSETSGSAVNIIVMRQAPLVGRAGGLLEGQGASEGGRKRKRERRRKKGIKLCFTLSV